MFRDRQDAGRQLLDHLPELDPAQTVILALPRGGLPVAEVIAEGLGAPLDIALVRKVGCPGQPELAVAAVTDGSDPQFTINSGVARMAGLGEDDIRTLAEPELETIRKRRELYLKGRVPVALTGKTVVVVDDGIATGATMRAALRLVRKAGPARLLVAVPVAPQDAIAEIARDCDDLICIDTPRPFIAVGAHYRIFDQVSDRDVTEILDRHANRRPSRHESHA
ncbi:phosphoribosyltransferase family protein [Mameliella sp. AT18]|uniref:phosphoribosyltransferase n=1 Tax=Mameliella sp. AT18 TaxID=3028385 RepID=UPI00237AE5CA|nr:phosphoribosyltransferase family protein [Mameliella sp. AT18]MDD9732363.1 phosphoribosyltransferase family protein [Mameliella sp. AT18]